MGPAERRARLGTRTGITPGEYRALTTGERRLLTAWHIDRAGDDDGREWWPWAIRRLQPDARLRLAGDYALDAVWQQHERRRAIANVGYFTTAYGHVQGAEGAEPEPFLLWREQADVLEQMTTTLRLIVLKARQLGLTWLALHYAIWLQAFNAATVHAKIMCLSKNGDEATKLLARARRITALLPPYMRPAEDPITRGSLSRYKLAGRGEMISLTSTPAAARSETARLALIDEAAFVRNRGFEPTHTAVQPSLGTAGQEIVLSTGNGPAEAPGDGQGFAKLWTATRAGDNDFVGVFLPTSVHPDRDDAWRQTEQRRYLTDEAFYAEHPETEDQALMGQEGDKVYSPQGLTAAAAVGRELDQLRYRGELAPPAGGLLAIGTDWGEHTHILVIWPLERGGIYVPMEFVGTHLEPGQSTLAFLEQLQRLDYWPAASKALEARNAHALQLFGEQRYDSAGIQSNRTFAATARKHHPRIRIKAIPFGAKMGAGTKGYKRETIGYLRRLVRRTGEGETTQILALGEATPELLRQMRGLEWPDDGGDMPIDGDDHGPDALIAGAAPIAARFRADLEKGTS